MPDQLSAADLVVIGGGPAGTTLAGLIKKYAPERRVVLLEKCAGPRHHVGESLLPAMVPVLKELGVFAKIDAAGFPRKIGANYIWGESREVWENDFNDENVTEMITRRGGIPDKIEYAWQVRRSEYDEILLKHAEELGVEVVRGASAEGILEDGETIEGVRWRDASGAARETRGRVADCSGQNGFLSRFRRIRDYDPRMRQVAGYAYFKDARWKYEFSGHPDKTKIFICSIARGWLWFIPIAKDVVSIGLVTPVERLKGGKDLRSVFFEELDACAEIKPLLAEARLMEDFEGTGKDFFTQSDWSFLNARASGPGWLACGDAALFIDPILSTGVTLAHFGAHRAAYTLLAEWRDPSHAELLWKDFSTYTRESAALFMVLAMFWYGNDRTAKGWWKRAKELQRAWLPVELDDHQAFIAVSTGLTRHFERLLSTIELLDDQVTRPEEYPFYKSVLKGGEVYPDLPKPEDRPRLLHPFAVELVFHPRVGEGVLVPVKRVRFLKHPQEDALSDALNPRRFVTRYHLSLLACLDGKRTLREAGELARREGVPDWWLEQRAPVFLRELRLQNAAEWEPARAGVSA